MRPRRNDSMYLIANKPQLDVSDCDIVGGSPRDFQKKFEPKVRRHIKRKILIS